MNSMLWTLIIMVVLDAGCLAREKTCEEWIADGGYKEGEANYEQNRNFAIIRNRAYDLIINVWATAYASAIVRRPNYFSMSELCGLFKNNTGKEMEQITPDSRKTCLEWLYISGFSDDEDKKRYNFHTARRQFDEKVHTYLSSCAIGYIMYIIIPGYGNKTPKWFCSDFRKQPEDQKLDFRSCEHPHVPHIPLPRQLANSNN